MGNIKQKLSKGTLVSLLLLASAVQVKADSLVLTLSNGSLVYYSLSGDTKPVMHFDSEKAGFSIGADNYVFSGVKNFFISEVDGIDNVVADKPSIHSGLITVKGRSASVYTIDGKKVDVEVVVNGEMQTIDLSGLQKGVYVIKSGNSSFKVRK